MDFSKFLSARSPFFTWAGRHQCHKRHPWFGALAECKAKLAQCHGSGARIQQGPFFQGSLLEKNLTILNCWQIVGLLDLSTSIFIHFLHLSNSQRGQPGQPFFWSQGSLSRGDNIKRGTWTCLARCQHLDRYLESSLVALTNRPNLWYVVDHLEAILENTPSIVSRLGAATKLDSQKHVTKKNYRTPCHSCMTYIYICAHEVLGCRAMTSRFMGCLGTKASPWDPWNFEVLFFHPCYRPWKSHFVRWPSGQSWKF